MYDYKQTKKEILCTAVKNLSMLFISKNKTKMMNLYDEDQFTVKCQL